MSDQPNILLIMTDQQRWDALGCAGGWVRTPNLDRLAKEGVRFTDCVTTSPVCMPARLNFATGHYCHNTGIWANAKHTLAPETPTWMQAIRDAGYRTALFGKTHWHPHSGDVREREHLLHAYGFDDVNETTGPRATARSGSYMTEQWERKGLLEAHRADFRDRFANDRTVVRPSALPLEEYYDTYVGQAAKQYLEDYAHELPWFCFVSFGGPHEPWDTPEPFASQHAPGDMPPPRAMPESAHDRPRGRLDDRLDDRPELSPQRIADMRADYAGNIALIDAQIGEMLDVLEKRGELANTVIAFTSDHGEMNGDAGLIYKQTFLDGAVRVPMIVRTPATANSDNGGRTNANPVEWSDLGPTLVDLAGGTIEHRQFATSLTPALNDPPHAHRIDAISEINGEVMLMTPQWKIAINQDGQAYLLFNRINDPEETVNLAGDPAHREITDTLRLRILERLVQSQIGAGL